MRRTVTRVIAGLLVLAAACSEGDPADGSPTTVITAPGVTTTVAPTTTTTTSSTTSTIVDTGPVYGGRVVIGIGDAMAGGGNHGPSTFNPFLPGSLRAVSDAFHASVFDVDPVTLELVPELVREMPTVGNGGVVVNDDGTMVVRYEIREEAVWSDGVPISGDDFAFTVTTLLDHADDVWAPPALDLVDRDSIVTGPKTFEVTLTQPTLEFEMMLREIVPRHQVEGTDFLLDWNDVPWVSAGPFVYADRDAGVISAVRNDRYWKTTEEGERLPYLDGVEFHYLTISDYDGLIDRFLAGDVDALGWWVLDESVVKAGAEVAAGPVPVWEHFGFNFGVNNRNPGSLNRHLKFRQAVAHAIDRQWLVDEYYQGHGEPLDSIWDAYTPGVSTDGWAQYDYDPDRSRELLAELCAELGRDCDAEPPVAVFSTSATGDTRFWMSHRIEEMLTEVGIDFVMDLEDNQRFFGATIDKGDWDTGMWAWAGSPGLAAMVSFLDIMDPDNPPPGGKNFYRWGTPAVTGAPLLSDVFYSEDEPQLDPNQGASTVIDEHTERFAEIVDLVHVTVDEEEIRALLREAEQILADQAVIIPLYPRIEAVAYWPDRVGGIEHNSWSSFTWNVEHWYQPGG